MTGRDDAQAHFDAAVGRKCRERRHSPSTATPVAVHGRADDHPGGARRRRLHPAPVLPPGFQAARLVQALHGEGRRPPDGVAAPCAPQPGMVVESDTPALNDQRRALVQMLFVEGNHFCPSCEKSGNCKLQATAYELGMMSPHFDHFFPDRPVDASHPRRAARFQPLHPVLAVRARQPRRRRQERVRALRARHHARSSSSTPSRAASPTPTSRCDDRAVQRLPGGRDPAASGAASRSRSASACST